MRFIPKGLVPKIKELIDKFDKGYEWEDADDILLVMNIHVDNKLFRLSI